MKEKESKISSRCLGWGRRPEKWWHRRRTGSTAEGRFVGEAESPDLEMERLQAYLGGGGDGVLLSVSCEVLKVY